MNDDVLMFAAIFIVAVVAICGGVFLVTLNRVGISSRARPRRRKSGYRSAVAHRAFKDVL
jgi:hypothetical protein